ncbi:MAG: ketoacyl-ACP synthase III [Elusimicrobia bacterium]|nr:ketoacyl-ACP synthase III [Elusimicrobiota bacterium]MBU2615419.1 ketoacyl-ACP synthase III [Elusimicrobiota bacterium]
MDKRKGIKIIGTGSFIPEKIITNADLEKMVDTTDEWITQRTGIKERHIVEPGVPTSDIAVEASKKAIKDAGIDPQEVDLIIVATATPDMFFPSTACVVQKKLGIKSNPVSFDIFAACSGFLYALGIAKNMLECGQYKTALVIGAETLSKVTNWKDRGTCILFGDGAGAMLIRATDEETNILSITLGANGSYTDILEIPAGGSRYPATLETIEQGLHYIRMDGKEVFKHAVISMLKATNKALDMCNKKIEDIALLIPHQANMRIIEALGERLKLPREKIFVNLHKYGNLSAATTIVALDEARKQGLVKEGDLVELVAFGSGLTWGAGVVRL